MLMQSKRNGAFFLIYYGNILFGSDTKQYMCITIFNNELELSYDSLTFRLLRELIKTDDTADIGTFDGVELNSIVQKYAVDPRYCASTELFFDAIYGDLRASHSTVPSRSSGEVYGEFIYVTLQDPGSGSFAYSPLSWNYSNGNNPLEKKI